MVNNKNDGSRIRNQVGEIVRKYLKDRREV